LSDRQLRKPLLDRGFCVMMNTNTKLENGMNFQSEILKQLKELKKMVVERSETKLSFYRYDNMPLTIHTDEVGAVGVPHTTGDKVGNFTNNEWKRSAVVEAKLKASGTVGDLDKIIKFMYENYFLDRESHDFYLIIAMTKPYNNYAPLFDNSHVAIAKQNFTYDYDLKKIKFGTTLVGYLPNDPQYEQYVSYFT
jgi:hypothetical protein